jgi:hypothetical protein
MTAGRHHSSDSSEHIIEANDVEMQSYNSPNARHTPSDSSLDRKLTEMSARENGSNSPTLIIQRNGEMLTPGEGERDATFHKGRPERDVQVQDLSIRERDFTK